MNKYPKQDIMFKNLKLKERLQFELAWNWNNQRHKVVVYGIMFSAIIAGSILLSGNVAHNLAEAGRHRN